MKVSETSKGTFGNSNLQLEALQRELMTALLHNYGTNKHAKKERKEERKKEGKKDKTNSCLATVSTTETQSSFLRNNLTMLMPKMHTCKFLIIHLHRMLSSDIFCGKGRHCTTDWSMCAFHCGFSDIVTYIFDIIWGTLMCSHLLSGSINKQAICDSKLLPRCEWDLRSFRILRSVEW